MQHNSATVAHILDFRLKKHLNLFYQDYPDKEDNIRVIVQTINQELRNQIRKIVPVEVSAKYKALLEVKEIEEKEMIAKLKEDRKKEERKKDLENYMAIKTIISEKKPVPIKERDCEIINPFKRLGEVETELNDTRLISNQTIDMLKTKNEELERLLEEKNRIIESLTNEVELLNNEKTFIEKDRNFLKREYFNLLRKCRRMKLNLYK